MAGRPDRRALGAGHGVTIRSDQDPQTFAGDGLRLRPAHWRRHLRGLGAQGQGDEGWSDAPSGSRCPRSARCRSATRQADGRRGQRDHERVVDPVTSKTIARILTWSRTAARTGLRPALPPQARERAARRRRHRLLRRYARHHELRRYRRDRRARLTSNLAQCTTLHRAADWRGAAEHALPLPGEGAFPGPGRQDAGRQVPDGRASELDELQSCPPAPARLSRCPAARVHCPTDRTSERRPSIGRNALAETVAASTLVRCPTGDA